MSRVQLALNVANIDESVAFYSALFQTQPHKRRPGYANFQIAEPPLKLVLIEGTTAGVNSGATGTLNHLGIEVESTTEVHDALTRSAEAGMTATAEFNTNCCFAVQDKIWISDPTGIAWEVYTVTNDDPEELAESSMNDGACCVPDSISLEAVNDGAVASSCC